jgi:hypothetical protein
MVNPKWVNARAESAEQRVKELEEELIGNNILAESTQKEQNNRGGSSDDEGERGSARC